MSFFFSLSKELDQVFKLISALPVSGDGVDVMSAAREHLRAAYQMAALFAAASADCFAPST